MTKGFKLSLLALICAASAAHAQHAGAVSTAFSEKVMNEIMAETPAEQLTDMKVVMDKMIEKMRANLDEMKKASIEDCVANYGEAKKAACECVSEKTDYEEQFDFMKKVAGGDQKVIAEETQKVMEKGMKTANSCGISEEEIKAAMEKAMKAAQQG